MTLTIPNSIRLQIGFDGVTDIKFYSDNKNIIVGTLDGRVRIYDCMERNPVEIYRRRWHKNITKLAIMKSTTNVISCSSKGAVKVHDILSGRKIWSHMSAHESSILSVVSQSENLFATGDTNGIVKFWDLRQRESINEVNICANEEASDSEQYQSQNDGYLSAVNDLVLDPSGRYLFAAMDDGSMVTLNGRKMKLELRSESLESSVKSIVPFKNKSKLAVATDEGIISIFNWSQFGDISDRFPVVKNNFHIEKVVPISDNVMAVGLDTGLIKCISLLPNCILSDIGHMGLNVVADCMAMDISPDKSFVAVGCPDSNVISFFSTTKSLEEASIEQDDRQCNKKRKQSTIQMDRKRIKAEQTDFLSGFVESESKLDSSDDDGSQDSDQ